MIRIFTFGLIGILIVFGHNLTVQAQTMRVEGTVTSSDQETIPGASIVVKGTSRGTVTDIDGNYTIDNVSSADILVFSFVGYLTVERTVGEQSVIDVALEEQVTTLDELVVVGYGTVRKSDLTGAVSQVKGAEIMKIPAVNPAQALQGKMAGVQVSSASGAPGAQPVVRVRGVGTFGNSAPVYVVDGVILDDISFLAAGDIESMEVLKDASAIAIYGARGANGVVMVTTKRGSKGKATINVNTEYSMQTVPDPISLLSGPEFATIVNEIRPGSYNNVNAVADTDWQSLIFQPAAIQNHQVSASGQTDDINYFFSLSYFNQEGIIEKSNFERLTLRFNNEYKLRENFRLGNNITLAPFWQDNTDNNAVFQAYRAQPVDVPFTPDGEFGEVIGVGNPLAAIEYTNNSNKGLRTVGNVYGEWDVIEGLTLRSSFGVDLNNSRSRNFTPEFFVSPQQQNDRSRLNIGNNRFSTWLWENTANYNKSVGKHRFNGVVGYTLQETSSEGFSAGGENIIRDEPDFWYINPNNINPNTVSNAVDFNQNYSMISYLGRLNYVFDDKYLFTATFRRDGSSKFTDINRYANFPAFAVGWNLSNENFMANLPVISFAKLRASWGATGNEKINYSRIYSRVLNQIDGVFGRVPELVPGATFGVLGNPDLVWETTYQTDVGMELGFLDDKIVLEVDYFNRITQDILVDLAVPGYLGNGQGARITYNAGEVLNRGFEFKLVYQNQINDFNYRIGLLGNTLHNEVLAVSGIEGEGDELIGGSVFNRFVTRSTVGRPIGYFYGYETDGVFQSQAEIDAYPSQSQVRPGDLRYVDANGDGAVTLADRTFIGSPIPDLIFGFNFEANYKNFGLSLDIQGEYGKELYNAKEQIRPDLYNFESHVLDRWRGEGTSTTQPRATAGGYNWEPSTRFVQDGSYLRVRNVTFSYSLPAATTELLRMQAARIYLSGVNMFTLTNYTGYSPEFGSEDPLSNGLDFGGYPVTAIYSIGANFTF